MDLSQGYSIPRSGRYEYMLQARERLTAVVPFTGFVFIASAGAAAEFGVVMLVYLDNALKAYREEGRLRDAADLKAAIMDGAVLRVRPKAMTVAVIIAGLLPIMFGQGAGSEVMRRIAAPMVGGMITAPLLSLFVIPAIYLLWRKKELAGEAPAPKSAPAVPPDAKTP